MYLSIVFQQSTVSENINFLLLFKRGIVTISKLKGAEQW